MHAPHCTPKTAVSAPLHLPLSARLDEISLAPAGRPKPFLGPFHPPGSPRGPLLPSNCANFAGAGAFPPPAPPPAPLRSALAGLRPAQERGLSASPHKGGGFNGQRQQRISAAPQLIFMYILGPLFFRSSLYRLVLTSEISLPLAAPSCPNRDLFGPSGRPRGALPPSNCAKFEIRWGGGVLPPAPPLRRYPAPAAGWATPSPKPKKKAPPSAEDRG
jgi:hypothetical protein